MGAARDRLDDDAWRHGVLKCLFTGVPVAVGHRARATAPTRELAAMVQRYAAEREAAGRDVPADVHVVLDACAACPSTTRPREDS